MRVPISIALAALVLAGARAAAQDVPNPANGFLMTDREAILLDEPELVCPGPVRIALWSRNGRLVLAYRERVRLTEIVAGAPPIPDCALLLWNGDTRQAREVWKARGAQLRELQWLPQTEVALATVELPPVPAPGRTAPTAALPDRWLLRIDGRRGTSRALVRVGEDTRLSVSPTRPLALLFTRSTRSLALVQADGTLRDLSGAATDPGMSGPTWSADGAQPYFTTATTQPGEPRGRLSWFALDLAAGRMTGPIPRPAPATLFARPERAPLRLRRGTAVAREQRSSRQLRPLWLEGDGPELASPALVCADSPGGFLSPRGDAVLYMTEGSAWVRALVRIDRERFLLARAAAERAILMNHAKQLGTAFMMWSQDYDEQLPPAGADVRSVLGPYLKNASVFDGFLYTHNGAPLKSIENPSRTVLGYTPGQGGRVVLFVDGHVMFEAEPAR